MTNTTFPFFTPNNPQEYERYLPTAFDESLSILQKLNKIIYSLNSLGELTNDMVEYLNHFIETYDINLKTNIKEILEKWLDDGVISELLTTIFSKQINVKDFGAKGDGITDDTLSFQTAFDVQSVIVSKVVVPDGAFILNAPLTANDNLHLQLSARTILKKNTNTMFMVCDGRSVNDKGYGKRAKQIIIEGGKFLGDLNNNIAISLRFFSCSNILVQNTIFEHAVYSGHVLDLQGCENIEVHNVDFIGFKPTVGRYFTEAIQIDNSWGNAGSNTSDSVNKAPTRKVVIKGCRCLPVIADSQYPNVLPPVSPVTVIYPAPNLVGNHSERRNHPFSDIVVENNTILYGSTFEQETFTNNGWIHFRGAKHLRIKNNLFIGNSSSTYAIRIHMNDYADDSDESITDPYGNPAYYKQGVPNTSDNIVIEGNAFYGFNSTRAVLYVTGFQYNNTVYPIKNVTIRGNLLKDCNPSYGMILLNIEKATVKDNKFENVDRPINVEYSKFSTFEGNEFVNTQNIALNIVETGSLMGSGYSRGNIVSNNIFNTGVIGVSLEYQKQSLVTGNIFDQCTGHNTLFHVVGVFNSDNVYVTGNLAKDNPATNFAYFSGSNTNCVVGKNHSKTNVLGGGTIEQ